MESTITAGRHGAGAAKRPLTPQEIALRDYMHVSAGVVMAEASMLIGLRKAMEAIHLEILSTEKSIRHTREHIISLMCDAGMIQDALKDWYSKMDIGTLCLYALKHPNPISGFPAHLPKAITVNLEQAGMSVEVQP